MIEIKPDPSNPDKLLVSAMLTLYLDKVVVQALSEELVKIVSEQARKDVQSPAVKKIVAKAAHDQLLKLLGFTPQENSNVDHL